MLELRDYQKATVERMVALYEQNPAGKGKFVWATGCGKTVGFAAIAHEIRKRTDTNVLIIAHREELLNQAAQKYRFIDPDARIGKVGAGWSEWGLPITVASIQTISRPNHLKNLKHFNFGLVIVDECHHAWSGNEYGKVLRELPNAFKIGCTATDDRMDKIVNDDLFGESIFTVSILDAVDSGYLTPFRGIAIKTETSLEGMHTKEGDYLIKELSEKIDTPARNRKIVEGYLEHAQDRQAMAFTVDVAHAYHLAEEFCKAGVAAVAVSGKTSATLRTQILSDFEKGKYRVITNCGLYTEGYDAETIFDEDEGRYIFLSCAIMARPTKSRSLYTQCIGRILRLAPTKKDALVLDATDNILTHRLEPQTLAKVVGIQMLDGESVTETKERLEAAEREKRERKTKVNRVEDITIDVLARLDWKEGTNGKFVLEVPSNIPGGIELKEDWISSSRNAKTYKPTQSFLKHRIALVPVPDKPEYYLVVAKLAPFFESQIWQQEAPLDWAQNFAERRARMLLSDAKSVALVDQNAPWRSYPASEKQRDLLKRFNAKFDETTITKGEAADILDKVFEKLQAKKEAKEKKEIGA